MIKPTIDVIRINNPDAPAHFSVKHHNLPYAVLIADGIHKKGSRANLNWTLHLTPDMSLAKGWDSDKPMTYPHAIDALERYANRHRQDELEGRLVAVKYITSLGFEIYLTSDGAATYDLDLAEALSYQQAEIIMKSVKFDMPITYFETDYIVRVETQDKMRCSVGESKKFRDVYYEHLLEQTKKMRASA